MTQSTEIISTEGVQLSGPLPKGSDLSTVYTAAVTTGAAHAPQAQILIELLTARTSANRGRKRAFWKRKNSCAGRRLASEVLTPHSAIAK